MVVTNPKVFFAFYRILIGHPNKIFMRTSRYLFTFYSTPLLLKHDCKNTPGHLFENLTLREVSKSAILIVNLHPKIIGQMFLDTLLVS